MCVLVVVVKKDVYKEVVYLVEDEKEMILIGFMGFFDLVKELVVSVICFLYEYGVNVKVLMGDNDIVVKKVCKDVGIEVFYVLLGF